MDKYDDIARHSFIFYKINKTTPNLRYLNGIIFLSQRKNTRNKCSEWVSQEIYLSNLVHLDNNHSSINLQMTSKNQWSAQKASM